MITSHLNICGGGVAYSPRNANSFGLNFWAAAYGVFTENLTGKGVDKNKKGIVYICECYSVCNNNLFNLYRLKHTVPNEKASAPEAEYS